MRFGPTLHEKVARQGGVVETHRKVRGHRHVLGGLRGMNAILIRSGRGRPMGLLVALSAVLLLAPAVAHAGTYTVSGCDASARFDGWIATYNAGFGTAYGDGCPGYPSAGGLLARSVMRGDSTRAPYGSYGAWTFWAPAGTRVVGLSGYYKGFSKYPWVVGIRDPDSGRWINCSPPARSSSRTGRSCPTAGCRCGASASSRCAGRPAAVAATPTTGAARS
jgi:hypothetical protein